MMLSGLRGAMAFAIAITNSTQEFGYDFLYMTICLSILTIYLFGGVMPFAIKKLNVDKLDPRFDIQRRQRGCDRILKQNETSLYRYFTGEERIGKKKQLSSAF